MPRLPYCRGYSPCAPVPDCGGFISVSASLAALSLSRRLILRPKKNMAATTMAAAAMMATTMTPARPPPLSDGPLLLLLLPPDDDDDELDDVDVGVEDDIEGTEQPSTL